MSIREVRKKDKLHSSLYSQGEWATPLGNAALKREITFLCSLLLYIVCDVRNVV